MSLLHYIMTALIEIITAFDFSRPLCFMAMFIVIMLLSSPGAIATIIGAGAKLGIALHVMDKKKA